VEYLLGAFAVYWVLIVVQRWVTAPEWAWWAATTVLGLGAQLLIAPEDWFWGVGIAGLAFLIRRLDDLMLLASDSAKVSVLRNTRR
jgi:hypothetical protein